jgi:hypothetical protein
MKINYTLETEFKVNEDSVKCELKYDSYLKEFDLSFFEKNEGEVSRISLGSITMTETEFSLFLMNLATFKGEAAKCVEQQEQTQTKSK